MAEKLYFITYKGNKANSKEEAPAQVTLHLHSEEITIKKGGASERPYPRLLAQALVAKSTRWTNGVILAIEEAKAGGGDAEAAAKAKAAAEAEAAAKAKK